MTHSLIAIPVLSAAVAAALYKFTGNFLRTSVIACVALASHLMLDYMNDYGVRPFLPFDGTTYYGDTLFIVDPVFDVILLGALIAGYFLASPAAARRRMRTPSTPTLYVGAAMELRKLSRSVFACSDNTRWFRRVRSLPFAGRRLSREVGVAHHFLFCDNHTRIWRARHKFTARKMWNVRRQRSTVSNPLGQAAIEKGNVVMPKIAQSHHKRAAFAPPASS